MDSFFDYVPGFRFALEQMHSLCNHKTFQIPTMWAFASQVKKLLLSFDETLFIFKNHYASAEEMPFSDFLLMFITPFSRLFGPLLPLIKFCNDNVAREEQTLIPLTVTDINPQAWAKSELEKNLRAAVISSHILTTLYNILVRLYPQIERANQNSSSTSRSIFIPPVAASFIQSSDQIQLFEPLSWWSSIDLFTVFFSIFVETLKPYCDALEKWIKKGELNGSSSQSINERYASASFASYSMLQNGEEFGMREEEEDDDSTKMEEKDITLSDTSASSSNQQKADQASAERDDELFDASPTKRRRIRHSHPEKRGRCKLTSSEKQIRLERKLLRTISPANELPFRFNANEQEGKYTLREWDSAVLLLTYNDIAMPASSNQTLGETRKGSDAICPSFVAPLIADILAAGKSAFLLRQEGNNSQSEKQQDKCFSLVFKEHIMRLIEEAAKEQKNKQIELSDVQLSVNSSSSSSSSLLVSASPNRFVRSSNSLSKRTSSNIFDLFDGLPFDTSSFPIFARSVYSSSIPSFRNILDTTIPFTKRPLVSAIEGDDSNVKQLSDKEFSGNSSEASKLQIVRPKDIFAASLGNDELLELNSIHSPPPSPGGSSREGDGDENNSNSSAYVFPSFIQSPSTSSVSSSSSSSLSYTSNNQPSLQLQLLNETDTLFEDLEDSVFEASLFPSIHKPTPLHSSALAHSTPFARTLYEDFSCGAVMPRPLGFEERMENALVSERTRNEEEESGLKAPSAIGMTDAIMSQMFNSFKKMAVSSVSKRNTAERKEFDENGTENRIDKCVPKLLSENEFEEKAIVPKNSALLVKREDSVELSPSFHSVQETSLSLLPASSNEDSSEVHPSSSSSSSSLVSQSPKKQQSLISSSSSSSSEYSTIGDLLYTSFINQFPSFNIDPNDDESSEDLSSIWEENSSTPSSTVNSLSPAAPRFFPPPNFALFESPSPVLNEIPMKFSKLQLHPPQSLQIQQTHFTNTFTEAQNTSILTYSSATPAESPFNTLHFSSTSLPFIESSSSSSFLLSRFTKQPSMIFPTTISLPQIQSTCKNKIFAQVFSSLRLSFINPLSLNAQQTVQNEASLFKTDFRDVSLLRIYPDELMEQSFSLPIRSLCATSNAKLLRFLLEDGYLLQHLSNMRSFFLMNRGDVMHSFATQLFESSFLAYRRSLRSPPPSERRSIELFSSRLDVSRWLRESLYSGNFACPWLSVGMQPVSAQQTANSFPPSFHPVMQFVSSITLKYSAPHPTSLLIDSAAHAQYQTIFSFLLQMKLGLWASTASKLPKTFPPTFLKTVVAHTLFLTRHRIIHILSSVNNAFLSLALSKPWQDLCKALQPVALGDDGAGSHHSAHLGIHCTHIGHVSDAHNTYLATITERCALTPRTAVIRNALLSLINTSLLLLDLSSAITSEVTAAIDEQIKEEEIINSLGIQSSSIFQSRKRSLQIPNCLKGTSSFISRLQLLKQQVDEVELLLNSIFSSRSDSPSVRAWTLLLNLN
ncbi:putative gamma-tubulin complex component 5 [Monocercomonoides exilis]|uniref:putative gamma-tubulin complex component 5 n=1 Tax=Monocercomonoides exilis TaxID=2049356 RepID=UPI003559A08A|nr:putative gamma-tubulin complex component 5 [Monocercomonoides exilis]|eukprot:MONOS_13241.1-p1 / transcript=MONOS_13241.1 / gene=MONOS_13241 / organism=Monocercomonoides_exilis_PA203 / gene_product=unspecified product / transcript_product=unspecified product / location=Mono_scaffold00796:12078-16754(-) / protein_length=1494 / sequence_SO=supercontig / SO=protein_coding / is_pseudo=false